jgi:ApaG protein
MGTATRQLGSTCVTRGFRVDVSPRYIPEQSDPDAGKFVFAYRIRISNEGQTRAQLLSRHWVIVDADGERHDVQGEGVVGQQPDLAPGQSFEYTSYCPLETPWGTMEGTYTFRAQGGEEFRVNVARFYLAVAE